MINPTSMGSSNMPAPGHNDGVSGGLPQDMLSRVLYASSRSSEEPMISGSIRPHFFPTTDGSHATASVHTESGGEIQSLGNLHPHTALPSAVFSNLSYWSSLFAKVAKHFPVKFNPIQSNSIQFNPTQSNPILFFPILAQSKQFSPVCVFWRGASCFMFLAFFRKVL